MEFAGATRSAARTSALLEGARLGESDLQKLS